MPSTDVAGPTGGGQHQELSLFPSPKAPASFQGPLQKPTLVELPALLPAPAASAGDVPQIFLLVQSSQLLSAHHGATPV